MITINPVLDQRDTLRNDDHLTPPTGHGFGSPPRRQAASSPTT
jgi:hypothetical protein